jgi:hypothetical protein
VITPQTRTLDWVNHIRELYPKRDPILIEKMIMALTLVESLEMSGLDFIFKGGTSILLLLSEPYRFSIDIDILIPEEKVLDPYFDRILQQEIFHRIEENRRISTIPKKHFKFYYRSFVQEREDYILLDILFSESRYPKLSSIEIESPLIDITEQATKVSCPTIECLLGDKLTAFAPNTTGIPYGRDKELEIAKQLFDVGLLFDNAADLAAVSQTFHQIADQEIKYRKLNISTRDVLLDIINTSVLIGTRGVGSETNFTEINTGIKKMAGYVYRGNFTIDKAIVCAAKSAYLAALILSKRNSFDRFSEDLDLSDWIIEHPDYSRLNKLKKSSPEAFYYFYQAIKLIK